MPLTGPATISIYSRLLHLSFCLICLFAPAFLLLLTCLSDHVVLARLVANRHAIGTHNTYGTYIRQFQTWISSHGLTEASIRQDKTGLQFRLFLAHLAGRKGLLASTIRTASSAVRSYYRCPEWPASPEYKDLMKGIARTNAAPPKRKHPFRSRWLRRYVRLARDRNTYRSPNFIARFSLLTVGFYAALRRSELAALNRNDIAFHRASSGGTIHVYVTITIRKSKTDQEGVGQTVTLLSTGRDCCPLRWLRRLLSLRPNAPPTDPLFTNSTNLRITPARIAEIVKDSVAVLAPRHSVDNFSGHSLRRGGLTALSMAGAPLHVVQQHARHKDPRSTAVYIAPPLSILARAFSKA